MSLEITSPAFDATVEALAAGHAPTNGRELKGTNPYWVAILREMLFGGPMKLRTEIQAANAKLVETFSGAIQTASNGRYRLEESDNGFEFEVLGPVMTQVVLVDITNNTGLRLFFHDSEIVADTGKFKPFPI
jgi:hypothetical protein